MNPKKLAAMVSQESAKNKGMPPKLPKRAEPHEEPHDDEDEEATETEADLEDEIDESEGSSDDVLVEEAVAEVEEGGDPELMEKVGGYDAKRDGNPPQWIGDEATWERAKAAVDSQGGAEDYYAVVTHVYKAMGGEIAGE